MVLPRPVTRYDPEADVLVVRLREDARRRDWSTAR
jgi:hypothetical protein